MLFKDFDSLHVSQLSCPPVPTPPTQCFVASGAKMICPFAMGGTSALVVSPDRRSFMGGPSKANIMDNKPMVNIPTFGMCSSLANPQVAAATSAALGVLTPQPCIPNIVAPWAPGKPNLLVQGSPALLNTDTLQCLWGGVISFVPDPSSRCGTGAKTGVKKMLSNFISAASASMNNALPDASETSEPEDAIDASNYASLNKPSFDEQLANHIKSNLTSSGAQTLIKEKAGSKVNKKANLLFNDEIAEELKRRRELEIEEFKKNHNIQSDINSDAKATDFNPEEEAKKVESTAEEEAKKVESTAEEEAKKAERTAEEEANAARKNGMDDAEKTRTDGKKGIDKIKADAEEKAKNALEGKKVGTKEYAEGLEEQKRIYQQRDLDVQSAKNEYLGKAFDQELHGLDEAKKKCEEGQSKAKKIREKGQSKAKEIREEGQSKAKEIRKDAKKFHKAIKELDKAHLKIQSIRDKQETKIYEKLLKNAEKDAIESHKVLNEEDKASLRREAKEILKRENEEFKEGIKLGTEKPKERIFSKIKRGGKAVGKGVVKGGKAVADGFKEGYKAAEAKKANSNSFDAGVRAAREGRGITEAYKDYAEYAPKTANKNSFETGFKAAKNIKANGNVMSSSFRTGYMIKKDGIKAVGRGVVKGGKAIGRGLVTLGKAVVVGGGKILWMGIKAMGGAVVDTVTPFKAFINGFKDGYNAGIAGNAGTKGRLTGVGNGFKGGARQMSRSMAGRTFVKIATNKGTTVVAVKSSVGKAGGMGLGMAISLVQFHFEDTSGYAQSEAEAWARWNQAKEEGRASTIAEKEMLFSDVVGGYWRDARLLRALGVAKEVGDFANFTVKGYGQLGLMGEELANDVLNSPETFNEARKQWEQAEREGKANTVYEKGIHAANMVGAAIKETTRSKGLGDFANAMLRFGPGAWQVGVDIKEELGNYGEYCGDFYWSLFHPERKTLK